MLNSLAYYVHDLNPVIFSWGPITTRWYGLSYLMGFLGAYLLLIKLQRDGMLRLGREKIADLVLNCCIFGVLIGGRLGYCLFYDLPNALKAGRTPLLGFTGEFPYWGFLRVWEGGMSAHGGVVFTILALIWFARRNREQKQPRGFEVVRQDEAKTAVAGAQKVGPVKTAGMKTTFTNIGDAACMVVPVGLCFGRIANFINGELYGHITRVPWAVKFPSEVYAPTNGVSDIPQAQVETMKDAVGQYMGSHWQEITAREVQDFLANHPQARDVVQQKFGTFSPQSQAQLGAVKAWLGDALQHGQQEISGWDLARWWEHGHAALHQFMYSWFDKILSPRHPSQIYEALLEGVLLFIIVWSVGRLWRKDGMAGGAFLTFYPVMRIIGEQFRVGDTPQHILGMNMSLGVIYSVPMMLFGLGYWGYWMRRNRVVPWEKPAAV